MPIGIKKYVDIKSSINTTRRATEKELIGRIFTENGNMDDEVIEFGSANEVGAKFGYESVEYNLANRYFSFINKYSRSPKKLSFARSDFAQLDTIIENSVKLQDSDVTSINAVMYSGTPKLTIQLNGGEETELTLDTFSTEPTTIAEVGTAIVTLLNSAFTIAELPLECSYDNGTVTITATDTNHDIKDITLSGNVAEVFKLDDESEPFKQSYKPEWSYVDVFDHIYSISNNFASFFFIKKPSADEAWELATHIKAKYPSEFMFVLNVNNEDKEDYHEKLKDVDGVSLELCEGEAGILNFILPMAITATTDYNKENGTVNYMFTQDSRMSVVVDDDDEAKSNDEIKVNYYGRTQQAGQKLAFYQNGVLQGNYQDQSIYVNEIWLKDALVTKFINYMLATSNWYANKAGQSIGQGLIIDIIERAKLNGTITTEKEISEEDKVYIYNITANENAWLQIYQEGYYLVTSIDKVKINNQDVYQFSYLLIYSKGDSIKKVEGQNILI